MKQTTEPPVNRMYKSRIFAMLYQEKKELLDLYNAISGKHYEDPELLEINTLENAIYMTMKNDLSFLIDFRLSLYEHQSTYSPNLPLRNLFYISDLYSGMTKNSNLYGTKLVEIPAPQFVIFYNGIKEMPDRTVLRLSDAYSVKDEHPALELAAVMLNINRETILLSLLGILAGFGVGDLLYQYILAVVPPDEVMFNPALCAKAFVIPAILIAVITFTLGYIMNRKLKYLDMLSALKSVE